MLQPNRHETKPYDDSYGPVHVSEQPLDFLAFFLDVIRQQFLTILTVAVLSIALGFLYVYITPPTFTSRATIILDPGKAQAQLGNLLRDIPIDTMEVESQIQLIKSETVALAVAKKLNLTADPEFARPLIYRQWLTWLPAPITSWLLAKHAQTDPMQAILFALSSHLNIDRLGANVFGIEFRADKPQRAAEIANAFAESYIQDQLNSRYLTANQATDWLEGRIKELGEQSALADQAVAEFKVKNNIVATGGQLILEQRITALNAQLVVAREKTAEARARLDRIEAIISSDPSNQQIGGSVTDTLNNPVIVKLRTQYLELVSREADWSRRFGKDHRAVVNLNRQIGEILSSISDELRRISETYKSEYEIAKQREGEIETAISSTVSSSQETNQAQIELRRLENSAETYRGLYKSALQRNTELDQQQSFPGTEARIVTRASPPLEKSGPKSIVILLASAAGGIMLGFALGISRMSLEHVFRTPEQVETILQANCLDLTPLLKADGEWLNSAPANDGPRVIQRSNGLVWQAVDRPLSRFAEALRSIKSAADVSARPAKVLGFTSSLPGEGKSMVGAAFALLAAQCGSRTILVDCDLRSPSLTQMFAPNAEHGLVDVLAGKKTLEDVQWTDPTTSLVFLPGATKPRMANSSDILAAADLRKLFAELRKQYDYIVVDLPPIAPIVDVRSTAGLVDAYVFIVEWSRTKTGVAEFALKKAPVVRENLLGVVLNKVELRKIGRYDSQLRDYYSDKTYLQYGDDLPA